MPLFKSPKNKISNDELQTVLFQRPEALAIKETGRNNNEFKTRTDKLAFRTQ